MPGPIERQWVPPVCTTLCLQMLPILFFTVPIVVGPHIKLSNLSLPHSTCKNSRYIPRINVFDLSSSWELITDAAPHWTSLGTPLDSLANRFRPFPYSQTPSLQAGLSQSCCCDYGSWEPSLGVDMSHCLGIIWESGHRAVTHQGPSYSTRKWAPGLERSGSWSAMQKTAWLGCVLMDEPPLQWLRLRRFAKNKIKYPTGVPYPPSADNQTVLVWRRWFVPDYPLGKPLPCFLQLTACLCLVSQGFRYFSLSQQQTVSLFSDIPLTSSKIWCWPLSRDNGCSGHLQMTHLFGINGSLLFQPVALHILCSSRSP